MKTYLIKWKRVLHAQSFADANTPEEAEKKALKYQDYNFEGEGSYIPWEIESVKEVKEGEG